MKTEICLKIDELVTNIDKFKNEPSFSDEMEKRNVRRVESNLSESRIIEILTELIATSQNANSKIVEKIIKTGIFKEIFVNFEIDKIIKMNPCDLADQYWEKISGIRQQAKLFHIVSLARKINRIGSFVNLLTDTQIPKEIKTNEDIEHFWNGFSKLKKTMKTNKIPFFRSTTSLLHFLLRTGYDCIKPDLVVMRVSKKIGIVDEEKDDQNLVRAVRAIQEYSIDRKIRPSIVDLYFLIEGGQKWAMKFVKPEFYRR
ncbi:MAG: hypothetical protein MUO31_13990 [Thermodesulfovibrionales bacterium]|nr:hypothetical protein [Thermodesulfovibrionales bacterium]